MFSLFLSSTINSSKMLRSNQILKNPVVFLIVLAYYLYLEHPKLVAGCGIENYSSNPRIVGGTNSYGWKYPWYGLLNSTDDNMAYCGASLISAKHFLTAAHCYDQYCKFC